jgi:serine/threonine protein kinase
MKNFTTKDQFFIVIELAKEGSLLDLREKRRNKFSDEEASQIVKSVLKAVKYIHSKNILHRDIKPGCSHLKIFSDSQFLANILVKNSNDFSSIKLSDFGISAMSSEYSSNFFSQFCGTPLYMAPELFNHGLYSKVFQIKKFMNFSVIAG